MFFVIIKLRNNRFRVFNYQRTKTMRYSSLLALCAFMLCLNAPEVRGEILAVHTYDVMTHTALLPKPVASDNTFSLAATWWLPDWQGSQGSRGSDDAGGGDIVNDDSDCMKYYNLYAKCPSPKVSTGVVHPVAGMTCQKDCVCPSEYLYSSSNCSGNYSTAGTSCDGKYSQCVCKSEFRYDSSNCSGEYEVSGTSCGGKYNGCTLRPDCTVSPKDCTYGCAEYNSCDRCISCKGNPDCDVSDKSCTYGCASYNSCSKCTDCNENPDCNVSDKSCDPQGCAATNSCGKCIECKDNLDCNVDSLSCTNGCQTYNSCSKCIECKSEAVCNSSSSNWCSAHSSCHGDCCTDGTIQSCDTRCGGSGCADPCESVTCGANAYCSGGSCYCNSGYIGDADTGCMEDPCNSVSCGSHAYCSGGACRCEYGYEGDPNAGCKIPRTHVVGDCSKVLDYECRSYNGSSRYTAQMCSEDDYKCIWNDGYQQPVGTFTCLSARYFETMEACEAELPLVRNFNLPDDWTCIEGSYASVPCGGLTP